jgi:GGDEF domain-containing protein
VKDKNKINLNAYLFANLVILCLLLIGLWNKKPVWDVNLRFPNLLLILVIINTILIFKEFIISSGSSPRKAAPSSKGLLGLSKLRGLTNEAEENGAKLFPETLEKLCKLTNAESMAIYLQEKAFFKVFSTHGDLPPVLPGIKFTFKQKQLTIKYPGNLGEEVIGEISPTGKPISFSSKVTRFDATIVPLNLTDDRLGLWIIPSKSRKSIKLSLSSSALHLETLFALFESLQSTNDGRYKDKSTGLLKFDCFADSFETEVERSERYNQEMSLLTLELPELESYTNDQKNKLKNATAKALKQSLRRLDLMFCGKKESQFIAILTETSEEIAEIVGKRIHKAFQKQTQKFDFIKNPENILNIGASSYPTDATHGNGLLEKSQEELNEAKEQNLNFASYNNIE